MGLGRRAWRWDRTEKVNRGLCLHTLGCGVPFFRKALYKGEGVSLRVVVRPFSVRVQPHKGPGPKGERGQDG